MGGGGSTHTVLLDREESKAFRFIGSPPLTDCLLRLQSRRIGASFIAIFMLTALRNLMTECLPPSRGLGELDFPLLLIPILSKPLMQETTIIFIPSSLSLVNCGTAFLCMYFFLPMTCSTFKLDNPLNHSTFFGSSDFAGFFYHLFSVSLSCLLSCEKKNQLNKKYHTHMSIFKQLNNFYLHGSKPLSYQLI